MIKLSIIIPQYKESEETLRKLLNTIANQRQVNFNELEVIIVNDCSDFMPSMKLTKGYEFNIQILRTQKNGGAGLARNLGTEHAQGKYILYLDGDDCLISCLSLRYVMNYQGDADIIKGKFFNESANKVDDGWTWIHGKFYKKTFLEENQLSFPKELRVNEDAYFNMLAGNYTRNIEEIDEIITFWAKNPNSTTRENSSEFAVNCFSDYILGKLLGFRKLKENGFTEVLKMSLIDFFVYSYYYLQIREFYRGNEEVKKKQEDYETRIARIIKEFWNEFRTFTESDFDLSLSFVYSSFSNYVDYRPRETFDNFRTRIYEKGV